MYFRNWHGRGLASHFGSVLPDVCSQRKRHWTFVAEGFHFNRELNVQEIGMEDVQGVFLFARLIKASILSGLCCTLTLFQTLMRIPNIKTSPVMCVNRSLLSFFAALCGWVSVVYWCLYSTQQVTSSV